MVLKPEVVEAFAVLGITTDVDQATATKTYKKLALIHHPDRNHGDPTATQRFQQIGAAWNICQRHFDNPSWSHIPEPSSSARHPHGSTYHFTADDDIPLDPEELNAFYMFMFTEMLFGRYTRAQGHRYRHQRSGGAGAGLSTFSGGFAESQERQARNTARQRKEQEEYEKRKRELELEIEQEEREREKLAEKMKADDDRRTSALEHAFQAVSGGNSTAARKSILDYDLDVNAPRKRVKQARKQDDAALHDTLLHVAAGHCDEAFFIFLIEKGANPYALNRDQLTPFHVAIKAGNIGVVRFIVEHRRKSFESYHPSKATPSGRTPLQLAVDSGLPAMVELLVKHATTHDVERCWKSDKVSADIKLILRSKKGFIPPEEVVPDSLSVASKKSLRQQELALQKEARIAEELRRAAINRQKKEERAARRIQKDKDRELLIQAQEAVRQKKEMERLHQLEDNRRKEQEEIRAKEVLDSRLRAEVRSKTEAEARAKAEAEARAKVEAEARAEAENVESCAKAETEFDELRAKAASQAQANLRAKVGGESLTNAKIEFRTKAEAKSNAKAESESRALPTHQKHVKRVKSERKVQTPPVQEALNTHPAVRSLEVSNTADSMLPSSKKSLSEEERQDLRRMKLREKRQAKKAKLLLEKHAVQAIPASEGGAPVQEATSRRGPTSPKSLNVDIEDTRTSAERQHQAILRRRAEQSARDKERHRRMLEDRAIANSQSIVEVKPTEYIPLTPVSTHTNRRNSPERTRTQSSPYGQNQNLPSGSFALQTSFSTHLLLEEDIQTCSIPDDLFREERHIVPSTHVNTHQAENSSMYPDQISSASKVGNLVRPDAPSKQSYRYPYRRRPN